MARGPHAIGDILTEVMSRRGFARVRSAAEFDEVWRRAAGPLAAKYSRPGAVRRGTLEVIVANSTLVQELGFQKTAVLDSLKELLPETQIENIRFRVGSVE